MEGRCVILSMPVATRILVSFQAATFTTWCIVYNMYIQIYYYYKVIKVPAT